MTDNSKHEVTCFIEKYVLGRGILIKHFNEEDVRLIRQILLNHTDFEKPDAYSIVGDDVYMLEHFQFDASLEIRKKKDPSKKVGSSLAMDLSKTRFNELSYINPESSVEHYINNLIEHFESHAKMYENEYMQNIRNVIGADKNIKGLMFLIEDGTLFGAEEAIKGEYEDDIRQFEIILTSEFMDVWKQYGFVKYIVVAGRCHNSDYAIIYTDKCKQIECEPIRDKRIFINNHAVRTYRKIPIKGEQING